MTPYTFIFVCKDIEKITAIDELPECLEIQGVNDEEDMVVITGTQQDLTPGDALGKLYRTVDFFSIKILSIHLPEEE